MKMITIAGIAGILMVRKRIIGFNSISYPKHVSNGLVTKKIMVLSSRIKHELLLKIFHSSRKYLLMSIILRRIRKCKTPSNRPILRPQ